CQHYYSIPCSF
nr:immunoglobulin light chain junction region [Macaca mulatta]MPN93667.1 immunoglobulin light chain junction region [Macaca mulatta]MPN93852.1 immunoglobulin light chain junction region [Macaca mulatta]MPN93952.1 immunoglobulin light chain junction region [Macaca mulatta]MPN95028.1 immunoglobulin light chain junction region [Macaca mulatta]